MNRDDIIKMAREANFGFMTEKPKSATHMQCGIDDLERFFHMAQAAEREKWEPVIEAVAREIPVRDEENSYNAPRHAHQIPGIWDDDNDVLAGKECAWCKAWNTAKGAIRARGQA